MDGEEPELEPELEIDRLGERGRGTWLGVVVEVAGSRRSSRVRDERVERLSIEEFLPVEGGADREVGDDTMDDGSGTRPDDTAEELPSLCEREGSGMLEWARNGGARDGGLRADGLLPALVMKERVCRGGIGKGGLS